jgi:hypothetical protein
MQAREEILIKRHRGRDHPVRTSHLSAFGILNRNGLEITNGREMPPVEEEHENKRPEFLDWTMPEQRPGYIKCKPHDFF